MKTKRNPHDLDDIFLKKMKIYLKENKLFKSQTEFKKFFGLNLASIESRFKKYYPDLEIFFSNKEVYKTSSKANVILQNYIDSKDKGIKNHFTNYASASREIGVGVALLKKNIPKLNESNIFIDMEDSAKTRSLKAKNKLLKELEKGKQYKNKSELAREAEVDIGVIGRNSDLLPENIFTTQRKSNKEYAEEAKVKLELGITRCKDIDITSFDSINEAKEFFGLHRSYEDNEGFLSLLEANGVIVIEKRLSKNITLALEKCKNNQVILYDVNAFIELSSDFFAIRINTLASNLHHIETDKMFEKFDTNNIVARAVSSLSIDDIEDFSLLELKHRILNLGYYIGKDEIIKALDFHKVALEAINDSIFNRMRLCIELKNNNTVSIDYRNKLPNLNTNEDSRIIILDKINNQEELIRLWKEYALFCVKNEATGHVTKNGIPVTWDKKSWNNLIQKNYSFAEAYFMSNDLLPLFKNLGYEGLLAFAVFGSRQSKDNLPSMYQSIYARTLGFFLYLTSKGLALFHPRYLLFTGSGIVTEIANLLFKEHTIIGYYKNIEINKNVSISPKKRRTMTREKADLNKFYLASASKKNIDIKKISFEESSSYMTSTSDISINGTVSHSSFFSILLEAHGNSNISISKSDETLDAHFKKTILKNKISNKTLKFYNDFIKSAVSILESRFYKRKEVTYDTASDQLTHFVYLLKFLDSFSKKLSSNELKSKLNIDTSGNDCIFEWSKKKNTFNNYCEATGTFLLIFSRTLVKEYSGFYIKDWVLSGNVRNSNNTNPSPNQITRISLELPI